MYFGEMPLGEVKVVDLAMTLFISTYYEGMDGVIPFLPASTRGEGYGVSIFLFSLSKSCTVQSSIVCILQSKRYCKFILT